MKISRGYRRAFLGLYVISLIAGILSFPWPPPIAGVVFAVVLKAVIIAAGLLGVLEEIIFRLLVVSAVVWLVRLVPSMPRGFALSFAILTSAALFGAAHLPRWQAGGDMKTIVAVLAVNGLGAIVLALIYVKWGIEPAIAAHFSADMSPM